MPKQLITIGSKERVDLPDFGLTQVPVKIDTGADSSAIWASRIKEQDGVLQFVLFDRGSPYYSGETVTVSKYRVASIKNSFGQTELRYKVGLKMRLAGRLINVNCTLADRSTNRYPILIGRRTLAGKFLVDVAQPKPAATMNLLLVTIQRTPRIESFARQLEVDDRDLRITLATYDDIDFIIDGSGSRVQLHESGQDIADFDLVHFKVVPRRYLDVAAAAAQYLASRGVPFVDRAAASFSGSSKLYQYAVLDRHGIAVPPSVFVPPSRLAKSYELFVNTLGLPFVVKSIYGSRGRHNFLVSDPTSFRAAAQAAGDDQLTMIAQTMIPNDGDYRILLFGTRPAVINYRQRTSSETHLNNTSQGASSTWREAHDLPSDIIKQSIIAAKLLERDIAGVDMVQDKISKAWYCLEVNDDPQISSGAFVDEKRAAYGALIKRELDT